MSSTPLLDGLLEASRRAGAPVERELAEAVFTEEFLEKFRIGAFALGVAMNLITRGDLDGAAAQLRSVIPHAPAFREAFERMVALSVAAHFAHVARPGGDA